jgi:hypothetical protein
MNYSKSLPISYPPNSAEYAQAAAIRLSKEIGRSEALAVALSNVVRHFAPDVVADPVQAALTEWLTGDSRDQLVKLEEQARIPDEKYSTPERLIFLTDQRNKIRDAIDLMEQRISDVQAHSDSEPAFKAMGAMVPAMELQVDPYRRQLEEIEDQISQMQAELEADSTSTAEGGAPQKESV